MLAERFLGDFARSMANGAPPPRLSDAARDALVAETYSGNVRQLKNMMLRAAHLCRNGLVEPSDLHLGRREEPRSVVRDDGEPGAKEGFDPALYERPFKDAKQTMVDDFERAYFSRLLDKTEGNLSRAAAEAGITRYYLRELLKRLGMHRTKDESE
jgi:DNA-binding NtrC family response regulator